MIPIPRSISYCNKSLTVLFSDILIQNSMRNNFSSLIPRISVFNLKNNFNTRVSGP